MKINKQIKSNKIYNSKIGEKEMNETLKSYKKLKGSNESEMCDI